MKKAKTADSDSGTKTPGTRIVEKYRPQMNELSEAERKQLLREGLAAIYGTPSKPAHAHRP